MITLFIMILKSRHNFQWLEFELLQEFPRLQHFVSLKMPVPETVVLPKQVHGTKIEKISQIPDSEIVCDAFSTQTKNLSIGVKHADCQATIIYDPIHHAVACVHSGWRGSAQNIYRETIEHMKKHYCSKPSELHFCIGPSLGPQNAEFIHYKTELPKEFWDYQIKPKHFDFWAISQAQATACGVLPHHIEIAELDTYSGNFYSYRKDQTQNRHITAATIL